MWDAGVFVRKREGWALVIASTIGGGAEGNSGNRSRCHRRHRRSGNHDVFMHEFQERPNLENRVISSRSTIVVTRTSYVTGAPQCLFACLRFDLRNLKLFLKRHEIVLHCSGAWCRRRQRLDAPACIKSPSEHSRCDQDGLHVDQHEHVRVGCVRHVSWCLVCACVCAPAHQAAER